MMFRIDTEKIKKQMGELRYSTYQLAAESGVKQPTIAALLNGRNGSTASDKLAALCSVLDLDINDVLIEIKEVAA